MAEMILPGTYVTVRDEALISAGRVASGNIGIVGTAAKGPINEYQIIGSFSEAKEIFGDKDAWLGGSSNELTLIRALEQVYNNGGRTIYAVRVASGSAAKAAFQLRDDANAPLTRLDALTAGTWGNEITIKVEAAASPSFVTETLTGNAASLHRSSVVANSPLNSIRVRQTSTGQTLTYELVYNAGPDNAKPQVRVDTATGALTFTTLAGFAPVASDTILARYQVAQDRSRKVELSYKASKESYTVADASHLAEQVNSASRLVSTSPGNATAFYNQNARNTGGDVLFGTGLDGNAAGGNGEDADAEDYRDGLQMLENEIINLVVLAGQDASNAQMAANLVGHLASTAEIKRERMAVIGCNGTTDVNAIAGHSLNHERLIYVAPGIRESVQVGLPGSYMAAAVAGLISSLPVQTSPTNKAVAVPGLTINFSSSQLEKLVQNRVFVIERRDGFKVLKGITTATNSAWHQVTTRRIVDFAIYGVRSACDPYIGKLNNDRVRGAMKATLDAFLTRMVQDEALISYELEVSATRAQEIAGEAIVTMTVRPTFSIDFIKVTMFLG
jgi:hypothetical protein